ncbi:hypothetical protein OS493_005767 [Desmophyllum pertusum]|uniref:Uncharacterized protein n=1 Tax=Desmophyllum pertusum TaxID=174260 RepID=A0A9W9YF65_9CNID|nr:hypothetical protein OS493_005767 [Desmophyllum pertusum]
MWKHSHTFIECGSPLQNTQNVPRKTEVIAPTTEQQSDASTRNNSDPDVDIRQIQGDHRKQQLLMTEREQGQPPTGQRQYGSLQKWFSKGTGASTTVDSVEYQIEPNTGNSDSIAGTTISSQEEKRQIFDDKTTTKFISTASIFLNHGATRKQTTEKGALASESADQHQASALAPPLRTTSLREPTKEKQQRFDAVEVLPDQSFLSAPERRHASQHPGNVGDVKESVKTTGKRTGYQENNTQLQGTATQRSKGQSKEEKANSRLSPLT